MRPISGTLTLPSGDAIASGTLRFLAEQSSTDTPKGTIGDITVTDGAYSGEINAGVYTVTLIYPDENQPIVNKVAVLGKSVAVTTGISIDVLTLCGLDEVPESIVQAIADAALASEEAAATSAQAAAASAQTAEDWAESATEVEAGRFSAKYWAGVSETEAQLFADYLAAVNYQAGTLTFSAATDPDFRADFQSIAFTTAFADTGYELRLTIDSGDAETIGHIVPYDIATTGAKVRLTGSGAGVIRWAAFNLNN